MGLLRSGGAITTTPPKVENSVCRESCARFSARVDAVIMFHTVASTRTDQSGMASILLLEGLISKRSGPLLVYCCRLCANGKLSIAWSATMQAELKRKR